MAAYPAKQRKHRYTTQDMQIIQKMATAGQLMCYFLKWIAVCLCSYNCKYKLVLLNWLPCPHANQCFHRLHPTESSCRQCVTCSSPLHMMQCINMVGHTWKSQPLGALTCQHLEPIPAESRCQTGPASCHLMPLLSELQAGWQPAYKR